MRFLQQSRSSLTARIKSRAVRQVHETHGFPFRRLSSTIIPLRRRHARVPGQLLYGGDVDPGVEQFRDERSAQTNP